MADLILKIKHPNKDDGDNYTFEYEGASKFKDDCILLNNDKYLIILDGVVLNKKQLLNSNAVDIWGECVETLYIKYGDKFFEHLKGSYYGVLFDKSKNEWIVFTDHIGSKPMYYHKSDGYLYLSNNYTKLVDYLKSNGISITLNVEAAYLLLVYGYVLEEKTILNEVKRLLIGHYGKIKDQKFTEHCFFKLNNLPIEIGENEAVEEIDKRFRKAIELAFEKDLEYGFKHLVSLSGGLDSRMTSWVANDMGYTNQLNITFSQSDYLDETIPKKIAADLKHEWLFKALDNGLFLKDIDEVTKISGGNVLYYGLAHSYSLYKYLNFSNIGMLHTGQLGDVAIGSYSSQPSYNHKYSKFSGAYSNRLKSKLENFSTKDYGNEELFKMNIRGFYGINMGLLTLQKFSETYSPFYDVDFLAFALSIPIELRYNHRLYKKWIIKKYPEAAKYIWESEKARITDRSIKYQGRDLPIKSIPGKILRKFGLSKNIINTPDHMNPLEYWYRNNEEIRLYQDRYYEENVTRLNDHPELKVEVSYMYKIGSAKEKSQVLSLLGVLKCFSI
jgi:asparagine synthase (glutamine-hydrolysing)